ncbi:MAG: MFS transporter, partial [Spirochaetota bacterium]
MPPSEPPAFRTVLPSLLFLTALVFMVILPRLLLAPLLLRVSDSFGVSYGSASGLFITGSFGFVTGLLTSGFLANRLRHRATLVLSSGLGGVALLALSAVGSFLAFHVLFFLANWTAGLYPGSGIASVTSIAPERHRGTALAIHESGPNLAFLLSPVLVAIFAPLVGWRGVFRIVGASGLVVAALFAIFGRASAERGQPPNFSNLRLFVRNRPFWIVSILFMVAGAGAMGVFSVLPTYLMV